MTLRFSGFALPVKTNALAAVRATAELGTFMILSEWIELLREVSGSGQIGQHLNLKTTEGS